jgi:NAD(P)-dependent dehydrogenase (short-subunit alcohol dehydrogenase family)
MMMNMFKDRVAIVTGGASGLGRSLCLELASRKTQVVVADQDEVGAERTAGAIRERGGRAEAHGIDVSDREAVQAMVDKVLKTYGRLDFMFNNAGIAAGGELLDLKPSDWEHVMGVNLWGAIYGSTAAYEAMTRQKSGYIVNVSSLAGIMGAPTLTPYATSKSALIGFSLSLRDEAAAHRVKVSVVCPGYIQSTGASTSGALDENPEAIIRKYPFLAMKPERAADAILDGLTKNQPMIIFPTHAKFLWLLHRLSPSLVTPLKRKAARDYRKSHRESVN